MATFTHTSIAAIKARLSDPCEVARRLGLDKGAQRQAGGLLVACPAHADRTPSCSLTRGADRTLRVRCFGCDLSGNVFALIAAMEGLTLPRDFGDVLRIAAEIAGVPIEGPAVATRRGPPRARPAPPPPKPSGPPPLTDEEFAAIAAPLLAVGRLDDSEIARDVVHYLAGRRLLELARAEGWAALPPPRMQPAWVRMLRDALGDDLVDRSGLVRGASFVHPEARLVIPWRDPDGAVHTVQRRRLDDGKPKYVAPAGRAPAWPYGVERLGAWHPMIPVVFVEGAIDACALRDLRRLAGAAEVVLGLQGVSGWRPAWAGYARNRPAAIALDADKAGEQAVTRLVEDLVEAGATRVDRWRPPGGAKDWAEALASLRARRAA
jgi:DNA primase